MAAAAAATTGATTATPRTDERVPILVRYVSYSNETPVTFDCELLVCLSSGLNKLVVGKRTGQSDSVDVHRLTGELEKSLIAYGNGILDVASQGDQVYVYYNNMGKVEIYNRENGQRLRIIDTGLIGDNGICVNNTCLYVTAWGSDLIYMTNTENPGLRQFTFQVEGFKNPSHITTDGRTIAVSSPDTNKVHVLNSDGSFQFTYGGNGELRWPRGVCIDKDGNILIADNWNNRVVVLKPSGELRGYIEVRNPLKLALDSEGTLYIASVGCNRLTVVRYQDNPSHDEN